MSRVATTQIEHKIDTTRTYGALRGTAGKWVADASISPESVGEHESPEAARLALVGVLRNLADALEKEQYESTHQATQYSDPEPAAG